MLPSLKTSHVVEAKLTGRFVLERHLKREEVIQPKREVGKFRGEPVYRRANVHACKTAENWMRVGRKVKPRQDPMKWVKQRAMTINRRREVELAKQNGEEQMQGLYADWQTEIYTPPAIKDVSGRHLSVHTAGYTRLASFADIAGHHTAELIWQYRPLRTDHASARSDPSALYV